MVDRASGQFECGEDSGHGLGDMGMMTIRKMCVWLGTGMLVCSWLLGSGQLCAHETY